MIQSGWNLNSSGILRLSWIPASFAKIQLKMTEKRWRHHFLPSDHGVVGSNPAGGEILPEPKRRFIAQSLSCSPFHRLEMTEILLKGRKTLTHPSIHFLLYKSIGAFGCHDNHSFDPIRPKT